MIHIRRAGILDAGPMAELLNAVIRQGGTTAITVELSAAGMQGWMQTQPDRSAWHLAEDDKGQVLGFQWIAPAAYLPADAAEIATFAKVGHTGLGIGSKLFEATKSAARDLGYAWINANIRADNPGGLAYYQSRGFEDYSRIERYTMGDGTVVDKVLKRYDL